MNEIEILIRKSLQELLELKCITDTNEVSSAKLVFPIKRDETKRVSEQESRFLLVKQLEKQEQSKYQYAIEAPTMQKYSFSGKGERSGNIDLIEFKALNHIPSSYSKDFEKLFFDYKCDRDNELHNFFVQILEFKNPKIKNKLNKAIEESAVKHKGIIKSEVIVFVCTLATKEIKKYKIVNCNLAEDIEMN